MHSEGINNHKGISGINKEKAATAKNKTDTIIIIGCFLKASASDKDLLEAGCGF